MSRLSSLCAVAIFSSAILISGCEGSEPTFGTDSSGETASITFTVDRTYIVAGQSAELTWDSPDSDTCSISQGVLDDGPNSGSVSVTPATATNYSISCSGELGTVEAELTVTPDVDSDGDNYPDVLELLVGTSTTDVDSDDDGVEDGREDPNANGELDSGETDPLDPATINDYYCDGIRNDNEDDGMDVASSCVNPDQFSLGGNHACYLTTEGNLRCWGRNSSRQLGVTGQNIGDDELPSSFASVAVGDSVVQITAGGFHNCALYANGQVRCWGSGDNGQTGQETTGDRTILASEIVDVGGPVMQISAGTGHTCAVLVGGAVRCWGDGFLGRLGYGNDDDIGDNETPASAGDVNLGEPAIYVGAGAGFTCALLQSRNVKCWGSAYQGKLGYGNSTNIGINGTTPADVGYVPLGDTVRQLAVGHSHSCALLDNGNLQCWGRATNGALGYGNPNHVGDSTTPAAAGNVSVGLGTIEQVVAGRDQTCVRFADGNVKCWGRGPDGALGYGNPDSIGEDETPDSIGNVDLAGGEAIYIEAGYEFTCALMSDYTMYCWGLNNFGQLGYGHTDDIGDDALESASSEGTVDYE